MKKNHVKAKRFLLYTSILYIVFYKMMVFFLQEKYSTIDRPKTYIGFIEYDFID